MRKEYKLGHVRKDFTGQRFGMLTVTGIEQPDDRRSRYHICLCDCGDTVVLATAALTHKLRKSCGCLSRANYIGMPTHGLSDTPEYRIWQGMKRRCFNPKDDAFHDYGGRGITVCDRWKNSVVDFYADMGPRPSPKHSIERVNNELGYFPENCIWADRHTQNLNKRNNHLLTFNGKTQPMTAWADELGIKRHTIDTRIRWGWPVERVLAPKGSFVRKSRVHPSSS